jgi:hypothetical protein
MTKKLTSRYCCWDCNHKWRARSTDRGELYWEQHVEKCPKCGSCQFEEHFPDGCVMQPYVPKSQRGAA